MLPPPSVADNADFCSNSFAALWEAQTTMLNAGGLADRPLEVEAELIYLGDMDHQWMIDFANIDASDLVDNFVTVPIRNARPSQDQLSYDREGFAIYKAATNVTNFRDEEQIKQIYVPELAEIVRRVTGAAKVMIFPSGVLRLSPWARDYGAPGTTYPAPKIHSDFSKESGRRVAEQMLDPKEREHWMTKRIALFSLWRALSPPPQDVPLALCDAQTVAVEDFVVGTVYSGTGDQRSSMEGSAFKYNSSHRWYYFRDMHKDELLFIKAYDSDDSKAWLVPHSAFVDPSAPDDAPPRMSIDYRALVFWD